jgi:hypothetical protein
MSFAYEADLVTQSFAADCDLSTKQYYAVKMSTTETIILASDASDTAFLGVLQDKPDAAGKGCGVALGGITKAVGGAVIAAGVRVRVGTGGKFVTWSSGASAGIALNACGADGELFSLLIDRDSG